jgi:hypothetical protein
VFPVYGFRLTIFRPFGEHLSKRSVVDNGKVTVITWPVGLYMNGEGTCTGAIRRLRFEIVNIEITQL